MQKKLFFLLVSFFVVTFFFSGCSGSSSTASSTNNFTSEPLYESPIDFFKLVNQNIDICAWIQIDGTNIDYPVTRTTDNEYYLTHDAYRNDFIGGGLFIDMSNAPDFTDPVTVIYGHEMSDGSIFTQLHNYKDKEFFTDNHTIIVDLPYNRFTYEIVAAFPHDISNLLYEKDYTTQEDMQALIAYILRVQEAEPTQTVLNMDDVTTQDRLLFLSTCDNEGASRYLVAARLIETAVEE